MTDTHEFCPKFADAVSTSAFHLAISRREVNFLQAFMFTKRITAMPFRWASTQERTLSAKGLLELYYDEEHKQWSARLTPAGEHLVALLAIAGMVERVPTANQQSA